MRVLLMSGILQFFKVEGKYVEKDLILGYYKINFFVTLQYIIIIYFYKTRTSTPITREAITDG